VGLETGTFPADLNVANPVASDKKNVGDDHLRLIKTVIKNGIPNWDRAFRLPEVVTKTGAYSVVEADENKIILCDTSGAAFNVTLPTPTFDGWMVRVVKTTLDVNPVYILPPSGTINGVAKMRLNVPYIEYVFLWTGSAFIRLKAAGETHPGTLEDNGGASIPVGYARSIGQALNRLDHPELFAVWGTTYGAPSGTEFSAPDTRDRALVGVGTTYTIGNTGGANTRGIAVANLPASPPLNQSVTLDFTSAGANFDYFSENNGTLGGGNAGWLKAGVGSLNAVNLVNFNLVTATINGNLGSGTAFDVRQPYLATNKVFRLC
jgi:microcystin-dependent protein